jgi:hypothetical protein
MRYCDTFTGTGTSLPVFKHFRYGTVLRLVLMKKSIFTSRYGYLGNSVLDTDRIGYAFDCQNLTDPEHCFKQSVIIHRFQKF